MSLTLSFVQDWWHKKNDTCPMCKAEYHINSLVLSKTTNDVARGLLRNNADELNEWCSLTHSLTYLLTHSLTHVLRESRFENGVSMKKMTNNQTASVPVAKKSVAPVRNTVLRSNRPPIWTQASSDSSILRYSLTHSLTQSLNHLRFNT